VQLYQTNEGRGWSHKPQKHSGFRHLAAQAESLCQEANLGRVGLSKTTKARAPEESSARRSCIVTTWFMPLRLSRHFYALGMLSGARAGWGCQPARTTVF